MDASFYCFNMQAPQQFIKCPTRISIKTYFSHIKANFDRYLERNKKIIMIRLNGG